MAEKIENHLTEQLCEAIASLKNEKQIANFIKQTKLGKMYGNMSDYWRLF